MHRFAKPCLLAVLPVVLSLASPMAHAQSPHKCSTQGRTWYQDGACTTPQPHDRTLRKCVSHEGAISIQNDPCPADSRTAWSRATAPEQLSEARRRSLLKQARQRDADSRYLSRLAGTDRLDRQTIDSKRSDARRSHAGHIAARHLDRRPLDARPSRTSTKHAACDAAKQDRETVLKRVGLARTVDLLRALNDRVYEACQ